MRGRGSVFAITGKPNWYALAYEAGRWRRRSTGTASKATAERIARDWHDRGVQLEAGVMPEVRGRDKGLRELVDLFIEDRRISGDRPSDRHLDETRSKLVRLIERAGWQMPQDLEPITLKRAIVAACASKERDGTGRPVEQGSHATMNRYLAAATRFGRWLEENKFLARHPFGRVKQWPERAHRRECRRAATFDELRRLIAGMSGLPTRAGVRAVDRKALYLLAMTTGLRLGELRQLKVRSLELEPEEGEHPCVRLKLSQTKGGRRKNTDADEVIPLPQAYVAWLRWWVGDRSPGEALWRRLPRSMAKTLSEDLEAVGIDPGSRVDRLDFHALGRSTFGTRLARSGAGLDVTSRAMRHSNVEITRQHYVKGVNEELVRSIESLEWPNPGSEGSEVRSGGCAFVARENEIEADGAGPNAEPTERAGCAASSPQGSAASDLVNGGGPMRTDECGKAGAGFEPANNGFAIRAESVGTDTASVEGKSHAQPALRQDAQPLGTGGRGPRVARLLRADARARADAGDEPDLERALASVRDLAALAAAEPPAEPAPHSDPDADRGTP